MKSSLSSFKITPVAIKDIPERPPRVGGEYRKLIDQLQALSKTRGGVHIQFPTLKVAHHRTRLIVRYAHERKLLAFVVPGQDRISRYIYLKTIGQAQADGDEIPAGFEDFDG